MTDINGIAKCQSQRDQYWPEVEQYFSSLSPHLFRQGVLLKNNLAIAYSDTGQFKDILSRDRDHPLLYLHFWLLDDLHFPNTPERGNLEKHLFLAMAFAFASVYTQETILDEGSSIDNSFLLLAHTLTRQADIHLAHLYPGQSPFWSYHQTFWQEYAEAVLLTTDDRSLTADQEMLEEVGRIAEKLAFTKIPLAAVAISAGQEAILPQLLAIMDRLNFIFQTMRDISTLRNDIIQRNYTYPIIRTMQEAGIDPHQPIIPERILGALVLTGTIEKICQESLNHLDNCRDIANELSLPTFITHFAVIEELITEVRQLFSLKKKSGTTMGDPSPKKPSRPFFQPSADTLNTTVEMAEGYLLSDLTFRESWEVQRGGILNLPQLVATAFPSGLIIEVLCRNGHDLVTQQVDGVFQTVQRNKFRYYDEMQQLPPDADDLGLLLRLYRYSKQKETHREILQMPLHWMKGSILPTGEIPVWFKTDETISDEKRPEILVWGNSCATTETNLLLGLIDYDWTGYRDIIEKSTLNLLERFRINGLGATLYYLPPYILWATFELISQLSTKSIGVELQEALDRARELFLEWFRVEIKRQTITPLDAAFFTLTCQSVASGDFLKSLFEERWLSILLKSQRHDGSWGDEPLFLIPDWRGTTWYSSRSVTTAFCYHALKTYQGI